MSRIGKRVLTIPENVNVEVNGQKVTVKGPNADNLLLCVSSAIGFTWSINCDNWLLPKNSLITAVTGLMLIKVFGVTVSIS